jgi:YVTN family beta-propeller protein
MCAVRALTASLLAVVAVSLAACGGSTPHVQQPPTERQQRTRAVATDPPALQASVAGRLPAPVQDPATTAVGARALLMGGLDQSTASVSDVIAAGPDGARSLGTLPQAIHDAAAASMAGTAYVLGGGEPSHDEIVAIDPAGKPSVVGQLPAPASDVAAATVGGTVYIVGGYTGTDPLASIVAWSGSGRGRIIAHLPHPVRYAAVAAAGGRVIIAGGTSGDVATRDVYSFDPAANAVTEIGRLPRPLTHAAAAALGGVVYVFGGRDATQGTQTARILAVNPRTGKVTPAGRLPAALSDTGAAPLGDAVLLAGGRDASGTVSDRIFVLRATGPVASAADSAGGGVPPLLDPRNVYAADGPGGLAPAVRSVPLRVYVPNSGSNTVSEIDPKTYRVIRTFAVGALPQHVVPSYDLRTLWVTNDQGNTLTPIDPVSGLPGRPVPVADPYNMYFTPDGRYAVVMAEALQRIDFRDAHTMALHHSLSVPQCPGVNHADFTADGRYMLISCEYGAAMIVVDVAAERVVKVIALRAQASPQDVKLAPDGRVFYVADLTYGGLWVLDASTFAQAGFINTGDGAHGLYPSRDASVLYVSNRSAGTISVLSFATRRVVATWTIPGGSPDMGGVSASGHVLWLSGRYDGSVYALNARTGRLLRRIPVGAGPHGLCWWPQPGRYSLGHTGIMR